MIFEQAQEIVANNKKPQVYQSHRPNIFVNKLFCGCCGRPMARCTLHRQDGTHFKYKCKSNYLVRKDYCEIGFDNVIWEKTLILATCDAFDYMLEEANVEEVGRSFVEMSYLKGVNDWEDVIKESDMEIKKDQVHLKSLYENLVKAVITQQDYLEFKSKYEISIRKTRKDTIWLLKTWLF